MGDILILISCCDHKRESDEEDSDYRYQDSILYNLPENTRDRVLQVRQQIFKLIIEGRTEDRLRAGGKRRSNPYNIDLKDGPDLSPHLYPNHTNNNKYLPAFQRYAGRFFKAAGLETVKKAIYSEDTMCHTLLVSGMYGLISLTEPIQSYSSYLADDIIPHKIEDTSQLLSKHVKAKISDLWNLRDINLMNKSLIDYINYHNKNCDHKINLILDLLSEFSYQMVFEWNYLHGWLKGQGIKSLHRVPSGVPEPEFLPDLGRYYKFDLIEKTYSSSAPNFNDPINRPYFQDITELKFSLSVEPDKYAEKELLKKLTPKVARKLESLTLTELIQAENLYYLSQPRSSGNPEEKADRNMHYFAALECELQFIFGKITRSSGIRSYGTIGEYYYHLSSGELRYRLPFGYDSLMTSLDKLKNIRNAAGHFRKRGKSGLTWRELFESRQLLIAEDGLFAKLSELK